MIGGYSSVAAYNILFHVKEAMHAHTGLCNNILDIVFEHDNHSLIN